jgi:DNA-binding GntR family transcriptional regulator
VPHPHSRYLTIAAQLRERILAGEWQPGATLPRLADLAAEAGINRDTMGRAIAVLEAEGLVWAVPRRGTIVRHGLVRPRRQRGNIVKANLAASGQPGYSFPAATGKEIWIHHSPAQHGPRPLTDERIARLLGVPPGTDVMCRHRVTGPATEPPYQISDSWIHPRGVADAPDVAGQDAAPSAWIYRLEQAGHGPLEWTEIHRARMPTSAETADLQIPLVLPVLEIVRVGRSAKDGKPLEVTVYVIPSDRVETITVLQRDDAAQWPWPHAVPDEA